MRHLYVIHQCLLFSDVMFVICATPFSSGIELLSPIVWSLNSYFQGYVSLTLPLTITFTTNSRVSETNYFVIQFYVNQQL